MKTKIHFFSFDISQPKEKQAWLKFKKQLESEPGRGRTMEAIPAKSRWTGERESSEITLETEHLFDNQWNSNIGRVFDFYIEINPRNRDLKFGHYLEITPEMIFIRANTLKCGYTGQQFPIDSEMGKCGFNVSEAALQSQYLKENDLCLLRLLPVCSREDRPELTEEEKAFLLPKYVAAQTQRNKEDKVKSIDFLYEDCDKEIEAAKTRRDGLVWLLKRDVSIDNVIYYKHSGKFCFGWRSPLSETVAHKLKQLLFDTKQPFPFSVEFKIGAKK